ncbi:MAG: diguanylate cyclase [Chloroflexota bacterium]|nr:diguanylate cyclase [Chloroflexota bacterium]
MRQLDSRTPSVAPRRRGTAAAERRRAGGPPRLGDERRFVEAVLEAAGSLVCAFDPEGRILLFNRACEQLTGWTFAELAGRPFWEILLPASQIEAVRADLGRLRAGDPPAQNENDWVTRDGAIRRIAWSDSYLLDDEGRLSHIVSVGIDVTDQRRADEALRGIETVGTVLAKSGPTPEALAAVLSAMSERMGYAYLALLLYDGSHLTLGAQRGYEHVPIDVDPTAGVIGRVVRTGRPAFVPDVLADPDYLPWRPEARSMILVPLRAEGETIGILNIESTEGAPLTDGDLRLSLAVADRLSTAILLGRQRQALAERARLFARLNDFARAINSNLEAERLWPGLVDALADIVPADVIALTALERSTGRYLIRAARGIPASMMGAEILPGEGVSGRAIASRSLVLAGMMRDEYPMAVREVVASDEMSMAGIPLIRDGIVLGAIAVGRAAAAEPAFSPLECEILTLLGAGTALAVANSQLLEEVSELAIRDALTGLFNRRHFDASLDHILNRWLRLREGRRPIAAVMFDLDHFGDFNKLYGHQAGDAVLRSFAGILMERFRSSDLVARYGGEEFMAILEDATIEDAVRVADEVRRELESRRIPGPDGSDLEATVSAGCAALDPLDPTREALLRTADVGLYMAKRAGRNRVVAA